jgi:hypothetical protein
MGVKIEFYCFWNKICKRDWKLDHISSFSTCQSFNELNKTMQHVLTLIDFYSYVLVVA